MPCFVEQPTFNSIILPCHLKHPIHSPRQCLEERQRLDGFVQKNPHSVPWKQSAFYAGLVSYDGLFLLGWLSCDLTS